MSLGGGGDGAQQQLQQLAREIEQIEEQIGRASCRERVCLYV